MSTPTLQRGRRVPLKNIGGHGPGDGSHYPFGLEPEVSRLGWAAPALANLPGWCAAKGQNVMGIWMKDGNEGRPIHSNMWERARCERLAIANMFHLDNFIGNLNSDANCKPILYLPPLPRADGMSLSKWLEKCEREALKPIHYLAENRREFSACFDTLGGAAKPNDAGRHYLHALVESLLRLGVGVGIEPPGEHQTLWHQWPQLFGWVSSWYLLGHEGQKGGWLDHRWHPSRGRTIYVNITPEHEQHAERWLAEGYHILTPVHVASWNTAPAIDPGGVQ